MAEAAAKLRYLVDSYLEWTASQGIPVVEGAAVDLTTVETALWPRLGGGARAAFVHLAGRGDFVALQVIELPPGARTERLRHLNDEVFYVLAGRGSASVETAGGAIQKLDWGQRGLFAPPLNAPYSLVNGSSSEPARLVCANDLPFMMKVFRNERFLFDNAMAFPERVGRDGYFAGEGDFLALKPGQHMWETNLVPDLGALALPEWEGRSAGNRNVNICLADSSMHVHLSELPPATYNKARYGGGPHVLPLGGAGYTLVWNEGDAEFERHDWRPGLVFIAPADRLHQHFNAASAPARHLGISLGGRRYPVLARLARRIEAPEKSVKDGGVQIDFADQDPRIHALWLRELAKSGIASRMERDTAKGSAPA